MFMIMVVLAMGLTTGIWAQSTGISGDSTINRCEVKSYTISLQNTSGNDLTGLVVVARLANLTGFSYVSGTASIDVNGGGAFCTADPVISGGYSGNCAPAPSAPYLTWNIDSLCPGSPFTLANGETLNVTFQLQTDCSAVSGSLNTYIDYILPGPTPMCDNTGVLNIQVNPGAVTIKKTLNVIPQVLGGNVTWTLTVENTGFGVIENVEITDVLGAGLAYVSSTQSGNNSGQTTTWTSNEYPALASMDPGDILTMDITATVIACDNLDNTADVRFGCDPSPVNTCFDTAVDGGTARASVQRIVRTPNISFAPPDVSFTYCSDTENVSFDITNIGDGIAYDVHTLVDFSGFTVSNVSSGAIYNAAQQRFELTDPLAASGDAGDTYHLSFDLTYNAWCGTFPSGDLLWQKLYKDECDQEFYPPVELSAINAPANGSSLTVGKNGAGAVIQIGDPVTYTVTSAYSGQITCGSGTTGLITVVDTVPDGFTVTDAGGGAWVPGGGGTGGTITWTYTPPASLNTTVTFQSPDATQCEAYCNTIFTNTITASGIDCCGCSLNASDSETTAIECAEGVTSNKSSSSPTERCDNTTYTNTYEFSGGSGVVLSDLRFDEHAELQQVYVPGSLSVLLGAGDITGCVAVTNNTPGGSLLIDFSGCAATPLAGQTVTITYDLTATANTVAACSSGTFYSWSSMDLGPAGSNCLGDGIIHETVPVSIVSPGMSVSIGGLGQIYHTCESKTITMTLSQTSSNANPKDVKLVLSGLNYFVVNPAATICGGVSPVSCTPTIDGSGDYVWQFNDAFTGAGQSATIQLEVQKRCTGGGDLVATAYFDDHCTDDAVSDELCSTTATETPALLLVGDLLIEKTPETYYANTNQVQWEIYVTNRGTGSAYNVWVDDVLGSGLIYEHGVNPVVVDNMTGVTVNDSLNHNGGAINGASIEIVSMAAGERRQITFIAKQIDCNNLTNNVTANWGCIGVSCKSDVTDSSIVNIPAPNLINTNTITPAGGVDACSSPDGFITLRNAGQVTCYNLQVTETLPPNLLYVSGSTRWRLNSGAWNGPNVAYDPNPTTSPLVWTSTEIPGLATANPGDTIEIEFDMTSDCPFSGGDITCVTQYENPCADVFNTAVSTFTAAFNEPDITINKTRANDPIGCNEAIQWTITVTNNGTYTLPIIWVEDTMDAAFTFVSSVGDPPYTSDNGTNVGQVVTWELRNVNPGDTVTLTLNATSDSSPCSPDLDNTVIAYWGCGAADGSSATKPGVDAPDNSLCLGATGETDVRTETRQPDLGFLSIAMSPTNIDACNDSTQLTIVLENTGPVDASTIDLGITLPAGITYNAGTAEVGLGTDQASAIAAIGAVGDPGISGSTITFYDFSDKGNNITPVIQADGGNDTLVLRFTVQSACYVTDNIDFDLRYYDCCDDTQYTTTDQQQLTALFPDLEVTKTANLSQVACGSNVQYTVTVTNNGTGNAEVIRVVDTLGDWLDYAGSFTEDQPGTITPAIIGGNPQIIGWEFNNLGAGATATFTFEATLNPDGLPNQNDCTAALRQNNVSAQWACGTTGDAVDDNPNTTGYDCTDSGSATAGPVTQRMPNMVVTSITPNVSCTADGTFSGTISVRVTNTGDGTTSGTAFTVQVTDGKGWTGTGTYSNNIAAGGFADVTINTGSWTPDCQPCGSPYSFNATVDLNNDICECNESDNSTGSATTYTAPVPDLQVDSDTLAISCASDGQATISGNVTLVNNGCNTAITNNVPMRFTLYDNTGCSGTVVDQWTQTFSSVNIAAAGGTQAFTISNRTVTANLVDNSTSCQMSIFVEADYSDSICECDGTNNTYCADNKAVNIPDIEATADTLAVSCLDDGQVRVSGSVTLTNNGCGSNMTSNVPMRFTLYDNTGCSGNVIDTWTQTFTGASIASGGGTQSFALSNRDITSNLVTNSTGCQVSIRVEADYNNSVCESDGTDNTYCADNKTIDIPNLRVTADTLGTSCLNDGQFTVSGSVTVANDGCGSNMNSNIPVRFTIYDNSACAGNIVDQWTETLTGANIAAAGGTQVFNITARNVTADLTANSTSCNFSILIEADYNDSICESNGTDNSRCSNKTANIPDFTVNSVTPSATCTADGTLSGTVTVNVENIGCANAGGITVRLTSDCGHLMNQTVSLNQGANQDIVFNYTPLASGCTCTFSAEIDPDDTICESNGSNNSLSAAAYTPDIPDLLVSADTLSAACTSDGQISVSGNITIGNNGCGTTSSDIPVRFTLYDNTGCSGNVLSTWTQTFSSVNIAGGSSQVFAITAQSVTTDLVANSTNCQFSIHVEADYNNSVCEYDGSNNSWCADTKAVDIPDLEGQSDTLGITCSTDGQVSVSGNVTIVNNGCGSNMTTDIPVRFTLFDNTGCTGNTISQWTETLSSANIAANGGTQVFTITPQSVTSDMAANSSSCQVSIRMEIDYTNTICESEGTDNTYCADNIPIDIPDLEYSSDTMTLTGTGDGTAQISGSITVANNGCGSNMTTDIPIRITVYDNINCTGSVITQWTETFSSANLPAGGSQTWSITAQNLTGNYCTGSTGCQVSMRIELDHTGTICESDGTDNDTCVNKTVDIPDLVIDAVATGITCLSDASLTGTTVTVRNAGCSDATNVVVRLSSDCGLTFVDETVDIAAGASEDVFFAFTSGITNCTCTFSAVVDPDDTIDECDGSNNTASSVQNMLIPDLEVQSENLSITCQDDGVIRVSGTVTLVNNGCGPDFTDSIPMRFTLFGGIGCGGSQVDQWAYNFTGVSIPSSGGTQTFTIQNHDITANVCTASGNCNMSIRIEADYSDQICEWDGLDNDLCVNKTSQCLDLEASAVTVSSNCKEDGSFDSTLSVTLRNSGANAITQDFSILVDDGSGWSSEKRYSADLGGTLPLAPGASVTLPVPWDRTAATGNCSFGTITATVDWQNEICQCTTENDSTTTSFDLTYPNLKPTLITPSCSGDGTYTVTVTVENDGCGPVSSGTSFTVHLEDNQGHTNDKVFTLENTLVQGGLIDVEFTSWPANCSPNTVTFTAAADSNHEVCEMDGTDNSMSFTYTDTSPDLKFMEVVPSTSCSSPGNVSGKFTITLRNNGNAPLTNDFKVIVNDGEGWSAELFYNADLGGKLPIAAGETVTFPVAWKRNFSKAPFTCDFNNIMVGLDVLSGVCECGKDNNETVVSYRIPYPDLSVESITPVCDTDGNRRMQVVIGNDGCDDRKEDFTVNYTDSSGRSVNGLFTELGGGLPLKAGSSQTLTFFNVNFDCSTGSMEYTVTIAPQGNLSDLSGENNSLTTTYSANEPDLIVEDIDWTCNGDGTVGFTVIVANKGFGAASGAALTIYDGNNQPIFSQTVDLAPGATATLTFDAGPFSTGQDINFRFVMDEKEQICECNGLNNEKNITVNCPAGGGGDEELTVKPNCSRGQVPGGLFRFEVEVEYTGSSVLYNSKIVSLLPEGFQFVAGSASYNGQSVSAAIDGQWLTWIIGQIEPGGGGKLVFSAVADADTDPGQYCLEAHAGGYSGSVNGTEIISPHSQCCTVVTRGTGEGCCLDIEEWSMAPFRRPQGPVSFIEPYFHTETAMFTVYSIFNLWPEVNSGNKVNEKGEKGEKGDRLENEEIKLEKGAMPEFMRERLRNYARSTMEEFYFNSKIGLVLADGSLWFAAAGAYPEKDDKNSSGNAWIHKQVDETVTVSQMAFEMLALNAAYGAESDNNIKTRYKAIIDKKISFLSNVMDDMDNLPHHWELDETDMQIRKLTARATLYDKAALYLALTTLKNEGIYIDLRPYMQELLKQMKTLDTQSFDRNNRREEFLFILALLESGLTHDSEAAFVKFTAFEKGLASDEHGQTGLPLDELAMAAYLSGRVGGTKTSLFLKELKDRFYLKEVGIFAEKQPDFTFKLNLGHLAPLVLSFNSTDKATQEFNATVLYRTFDEVGLFLKKRNLAVGKPLYSILKNYPFTGQLLPILSFTKANRTVAPVFSQDAVVHSTQVKTIGEVQIPNNFSKILSPGYQTGNARIAEISFALQLFGHRLGKGSQPVLKEEGRSLVETGKDYLETILNGGAGKMKNGLVLLPFNNTAIKGPKAGEFNLEPLNASIDYSTETLANYMLAEFLYVMNGGKQAEEVKDLLKWQQSIVDTFTVSGYVPMAFRLMIDLETGEMTYIPTGGEADKLTVAKLFYLLHTQGKPSFLKEALQETRGKADLQPEDLLFLSYTPELIPYFETEIKALIELKDSKITYNAADIIGRRLLKDDASTVEKSLENLKAHWDKEAVLPTSDIVENIENGLIYHHQPRGFLMYLLATSQQKDFRFQRTLNFFTYLLENEWGIQCEHSLLTLPSSSYRVFREESREIAEPGDLLNFRVRVDNACPEGFGSAYDLSGLTIKASFTPPLLYMGTQKVDGLSTVGDFLWRYDGFPEGTILEYMYQAYVPEDYRLGFLDGRISVTGRRGFGEFGPDSAAGDDCDDLHHIRRLRIQPLQELRGIVFEDRNVNGIKDSGETGVANILVKDTRGRLFRTDAEGRFAVLAGDQHEGVQIELKSLPSNYVLTGEPTVLVNRRYQGEIYFGLVSCKTVEGFVYIDENTNGSYDEGETRPEGIVLTAKDKQIVTGKNGKYIFRNLPVLWQEFIEISPEQPFYKGNKENLTIKL